MMEQNELFTHTQIGRKSQDKDKKIEFIKEGIERFCQKSFSFCFKFCSVVIYQEIEYVAS